jgi:hypothetical protein
MFVEQRALTQGQFNDLSIGMDRAQTLAVVKKLGAHVISPTPCDHFRISKANAAELPSLGSVDGVRITDRQSHLMDIYLSGGRVSKIVQTPGSEIIASSRVGDDEHVVRDKILKTLESQHGLSIAPSLTIVGCSKLRRYLRREPLTRFNSEPRDYKESFIDGRR